MAFQKFQRAEKVAPVSQRENEQIKKVLAKTGKASAAELTDKERRELPKR
jgi:hypothetical protein